MQKTGRRQTKKQQIDQYGIREIISSKRHVSHPIKALSLQILRIVMKDG